MIITSLFHVAILFLPRSVTCLTFIANVRVNLRPSFHELNEKLKGDVLKVNMKGASF